VTRKYPRVGDLVKVVNPVFVDRVGYPVCVDDFVKPAQTAMYSAGLLARFTPTSTEKDAIRAFARVLAKRAGFGGNVRSLHTTTHPDLRDVECLVVNKKRAVTGIRVPGYGGQARLMHEDAEGPYLKDSKQYTLLAVRDNNNFFGWIEASNVVLSSNDA